MHLFGLWEEVRAPGGRAWGEHANWGTRTEPVPDLIFWTYTKTLLFQRWLHGLLKLYCRCLGFYLWLLHWWFADPFFLHRGIKVVINSVYSMCPLILVQNLDKSGDKLWFAVLLIKLLLGLFRLCSEENKQQQLLFGEGCKRTKPGLWRAIRW